MRMRNTTGPVVVPPLELDAALEELDELVALEEVEVDELVTPEDELVAVEDPVELVVVDTADDEVELAALVVLAEVALTEEVAPPSPPLVELVLAFDAIEPPPDADVDRPTPLDVPDAVEVPDAFDMLEATLPPPPQPAPTATATVIPTATPQPTIRALDKLILAPYR